LGPANGRWRIAAEADDFQIGATKVDISLTIFSVRPQPFVEKFHFNTQQVGLQNLSIIIGSVIGEQVGGFMSGKWMRRCQHTKAAAPEFRLWLSYLGHAFAIGGVVISFVRLSQAGKQ
jgi:hypothetical protein